MPDSADCFNRRQPGAGADSSRQPTAGSADEFGFVIGSSAERLRQRYNAAQHCDAADNLPNQSLRGAAPLGIAALLFALSVAYFVLRRANNHN